MVFLGLLFYYWILINLLHLLLFPILTFLLALLPLGFFSRSSFSFFSQKFGFQKLGNFLKPQNFISNFEYLMNLFAFMYHNSFGVHFLWATGFVSWFLGCSFAVLNVDSVSMTFTIAGVGLCLLAFLSINGVRIDSSDLENFEVRYSVYVLLFSFSVVVMVLADSLAAGFTTLVLLGVFLFVWRMYKDTRGE